MTHVARRFVPSMLLSLALSSCVGEIDSGEQGQAATVRVCPERTTLDEIRQPRNAAGQIRWCWPDEASCFCDADRDCYTLTGYTPRCAAVVDAGVRDAGALDTGVRDVPTVDAGPRDTGVLDAGPRDTGVLDTGVRDVPAVDAGPVAIDPVAYTGSFAVRTGRFTATLTVAGIARQIVLYVPTTRAAQPPLLMMFHGTNGDGNVVVDESGAQAMANANGVIIAAPSSRWMSHGDWDHATEETYWETYPNVDPASNPDLLLVRAVIAEAQRRYNVDPARVYAAGHSNGGFFAELVAGALPDRVAAFATSSAGLVRCATTQSCRFQGRGATCASLRTQSGWCGCTGVEKPGSLPASGRRPPWLLLHGTSDPLVSVYYTCAMADRMTALGYEVSVSLRDGDGHVMPSDFAAQAWAFVGPRRRP